MDEMSINTTKKPQMKIDAFQEFFDCYTNKLLVGKLNCLADIYHYSCSLFINGHIRTDHSPSANKADILSRCDDVATIGGASISAKVLDVGETRNARYLVKVNSVFYDTKNAPSPVNTSRCLCLLDV